MPKKVEFTESEFSEFSWKIQEAGFTEIERKNLHLFAPRKIQGQETGFTFSANGLTVIVWTTFVESEGKPRDEDSGWVLILEYGKRQYTAHPLMRTAGFLEKLLRYALIAQKKVKSRPICKICNSFMRIVEGKGRKSVYWRCSVYGHYEREDWDIGISDEDKEFLKAERRKRRYYREKNKKEGRMPTPAMFIRKPWGEKIPANQ